jgi:hypothetical protein
LTALSRAKTWSRCNTRSTRPTKASKPRHTKKSPNAKAGLRVRFFFVLNTIESIAVKVEGWYEGEHFVAGVALFVVWSMAALVASAASCALWDLNRFARKRAPWVVALSYGALFSAFGYWIFSLPGALPGLFCVWAFERGRVRARLSLKTD